MRTKVLAGWFAGVVGLASSGALAADDAAFQSGRWSGSVHHDTQRVFQRCAATASDLRKTSVTLGVDRAGRWGVSLANAGWHIPKGWHYQLRVSIDGAPPLDWDALGESASTLTMELGIDQTLITLLRRGHSLQIVSGTFKQSFDLEGTDGAISQLADCRSRQLSVESRSKAVEDLIGYGIVAIVAADVLTYALPFAPVVIVGTIAMNVTSTHTSVPAAPTQVAAVPSTVSPQPQIRPPAADKPIVPTAPDAIEIPLKDEMGTFMVPVRINDTITLDFTVDSGASTVVLTDDVAGTLEKSGTVRPTDYGTPYHMVFADGSQADQQSLMLQTLEVGGVPIHNVPASVGPRNGQLLLGQSFLTQFGSWSIDNTRHVLILRPKAPSFLNSGAAAPVGGSVDTGL